MLIEHDHLGDWSPENDYCWRLTFDNLCKGHLQSQVTLKMTSAQVVKTSVTNVPAVRLRSPVTQMLIFNQGTPNITLR